MKDFPKGGLIGKTLEGARMISAMHIPFRAAYGAYFLILSLFPALLLVLSSLRLTGLTVEDLVELVSGILPAAMVEGAEGLIYSTYRNASSAVTGLSVVTLLWSSSKGVYGLLTGLNAVYDVEENRGYVFTRAISVVYALLFLVDLIDLHGVFLLTVQTLLFTAVYMFLPNGQNGFWDSLPGALFSAVGWSLFSTAYSFYITHFTRISNIYGSVYAVAVSMLWLYCCLCILFYGGALNRCLAKIRGR